MMPLSFATVRTAPKNGPLRRLKQLGNKDWSLDILEDRYVGGEEFSLGDIPRGVWTYRCFNLPA